MRNQQLVKILKKTYENVIYANDDLYICEIVGIGWDLREGNNINSTLINTFTDFDDLTDTIKMIRQSKKAKDWHKFITNIKEKEQ